jgi:hypothetical protein
VVQPVSVPIVQVVHKPKGNVKEMKVRAAEVSRGRDQRFTFIKK